MSITIDRPTKAWLDFVQGLKGHCYRDTTSALRRIFERKAADVERTTGKKIEHWQETSPLLEEEPAYQWYGHAMRQTQEMMWEGVLKIVEANREQIEAELDREIPNPLGSLRLRPDLQLPAYYARTEYHLRPGGMYQGDAQGFYTSIANSIYFAGDNDSIQMQRWAVSQLPDRPYRRILDMGCGIGQSTWPLTERFPGAEVHGCDLSAPLLTYAHKVAEAKGLAIHYSQNDAANTDYPDGHFDLVFAFIMFHEINDKAAVGAIREAYRLLEPGGVFAFCDIRPYKMVGPFQAFLSDWQTANNNESFWRAHCLRDYHRLLGEAGFAEVSEVLSPSPTNMLYVARKA